MTESTTISPETVAAPETLEELTRKKYAAHAARINAPIYGSEKNILNAQYDEAETAYLEALRAELRYELGEDLMGAENLSDISFEERIESFQTRINERIIIDREAQKAELIAQGGRRAEFLNWYTNLPTIKKIAVTAGLVGGGAAAGFVSAGLGVTASFVAVGVGAYRLTRGYAMRVSKIYSDKVRPPDYKVRELTNGEELVSKTLDFLKLDSQEAIVNAEKIKKRAVFTAVGSVALGSFGGVLVDKVVDGPNIGRAAAERVSSWAKIIKGSRGLTQPSIEDSIAPSSNGILSQARDAGLSQESVVPSFDDVLSGRDGVDNLGEGPTVIREAKVVEVSISPERKVLEANFRIDRGSSYIKELRESVKSVYGEDISLEEAWKLHMKIVDEVGQDYIDLLNYEGPDTYDMGNSPYEVGISRDGYASWDKGAVRIMDGEYGHNHNNIALADRKDGLGYEVPKLDVNDPRPSDELLPPSQNFGEISGGNPDGGLNGSGGDNKLDPSDGGLVGIEEAEKAEANQTDGIEWESMRLDAQEMYGMLKVGDIDSVNTDPKFQKTLEYIQKDIGHITYKDTNTKVIELVGSGFNTRWQINALPGREIPDKVIKVFESYVKSLRLRAA